MAEIDGLRTNLRYEASERVAARAEASGQFVKRLAEVVVNESSPFHAEDELARALGFSTRQLRRICWAALGEPVHSFVKRMRLERAAGELVSNEDSMSALANRAGYSTADAFAKAFRAHFGCSPARFRSLNLGRACLLPGHILSAQPDRPIPRHVPLRIRSSEAEVYVYDGAILIARVGRGGADWCPWRRGWTRAAL